MYEHNNEINILLRIKYLVFGYVIYNIILFLKLYIQFFIELSRVVNKEILVYIFFLLYIFTFIILFQRKNLLIKSKKILRSNRIDLLFLIILGIVIAHISNDFWINNFTKTIRIMSLYQLVCILLFPVIIIISSELHLLINNHGKKKDIASSFMSDQEGKSNTDDEFGFIDHAENFAEKVYDYKSSENLVFGVDAPWGTGKTTFINLCKEYWFSNYAEHIIVYSFEPLRYDKNDNLLEHFVDGLIKEIKKHIFIPEIKSLITRYSRILQNADPNIALFGLSFNMNFTNDSIDSILNKLENLLLKIDKKIIIVVDDLDRLEFDSIKDVLNVIKKAFSLPNISYVLCYDTENISSLESFDADTDKIIEFFEKYINVKTSIFIDKELLLDYFTKSSETVIDSNSLLNKRLANRAIEGINDIFSSNDFHKYLPLIGDARKIKRIINTIIMLDIDETDFENNDFNKKDLINLLLIFINYPNLFRRIYYCETNGNNGFFSVISKNTEGTKYIYGNSADYEDYLTELSDSKKFILNQIFDAEIRSINNYTDIDEHTKKLKSYACFNGNKWSIGGRNLEDYLNLIVKMKKPIKTEQYSFYINKINSFFKGEKIEDIFKTKEFFYENSHKLFWSTFVNMGNKKFTDEQFEELIGYIVQNIDEYSMISNSYNMVEFRKTIIIHLLQLLNDYGWKNSINDNNNLDEKVIRIAKRIFGENGYSGILDALCNKNRGVLGLNDLLHFRLYCNLNRHGDFFNITRGLYYHSNDLNDKSNYNLINEMREISQYVFKIFKSRYIDKKINVIQEINNLSWNELCGKFVSETENDKFKKMNLSRTVLKSFILYQLTSNKNDGGIGCGYYDIDGNKDERQINHEMNSYLYDFCFNPRVDENNFIHFLDYLLINYNNSWNHDEKSIEIEFIKEVACDDLKQYWKQNGGIIKSKKYEDLERELIKYNSTVKYANLGIIYTMLDTYIVNKCVN